MTARERSALRTTVITTAACPRCQVPVGRGCRDGAQPVNIHAERAIKAGVDPALLAAPATTPTATTTPRRANPARRARPGAHQPPATSVPRSRRSGSPGKATTKPCPPRWQIGAGPDAPRRAAEVVLVERRSALAVTITSSAADLIARFAAGRGWFTEEGGLLVGSISGDMITVHGASGPGPNSKRTRSTYLADHHHDACYLLDVQQEFDGQIYEVGGWHSHPQGSATSPSTADLALSGAKLKLIGDQSVDLIVCPRADGRIAIGAWITAAPTDGYGTKLSWLRCQPPAAVTIEGARRDVRRWVVT